MTHNNPFETTGLLPKDVVQSTLENSFGFKLNEALTKDYYTVNESIELFFKMRAKFPDVELHVHHTHIHIVPNLTSFNEMDFEEYDENPQISSIV